MADQIYQEAGTNSFGSQRMHVRFCPNGTSAPTSVGGKYVTSVTYSSTGTGVFLISFASSFPGILGFTHGVMSNSGGPAEGFTFEIDNSQTNLSAGTPGQPGSTPGSVVAVAAVNPSGSRATIAADPNTLVFLEFVFSLNTTLVPV